MESFMYYFYLICFLLVGLSVGSFINVVIYRLPLTLGLQQINEQEKEIGLSWPPSHCPQCNTMILKRDNVPLFSWIFLRGKCRFCKEPIPVFYPLTELIHGLWFAGVFLLLFKQDEALFVLPALLLFCLLYVIAIIDFKNYIIPDSLNYFLLWSGMIFSVTGINAVSPLSAVAGVCVIWTITYAIMAVYERVKCTTGLGGGDVKLFSAVMPWIGIEKIHYLILLSSVTGLVIVLVHRYSNRLLSNNRVVLGDDSGRYVPFGPAICLSALYLFMLQTFMH